MVIIATLVEWRNLTLLSTKEPLKCIMCTLNTTNIMLSSRKVVKRLYTIARLRSILLKFSNRRALSNKLRELIISIAACILREVNRLLDNSCSCLSCESFLVENLQNNITLCERKVLSSIHLTIKQSIDKSTIINTHSWCHLILLTSKPSLLTRLTVTLSESLKVSSASQSLLNRVSLCTCLIRSCSANTNLAELY